MTLHLLCAGAAQGIVRALQPRLLAEAGAAIAGRFGAVGAMKEALLAGEPCDVLVSTNTMIGELMAAGHLRGGSRASLGRVLTAIAVRAGAARPDVSTPEALRAALLGADAIYFPDALRSTAGIHFAGVMRELGIDDALAPRLRTFPNGAAAMLELAVQGTPASIGCTQASEILYTEGVQLVASLPARFELTTLYSAAVSVHAAEPALAARFIAILTGAESVTLREAGGILG